MEKILDLLSGNYWIIDLQKCNLTQFELDFLSIFFEINFDKFIDEITLKERNFIILKKKSKFLVH
jgi:hypothetical protein